MKKEYTSPEFNTIIIFSDDILMCSSEAGGVTDGGVDWEEWL